MTDKTDKAEKDLASAHLLERLEKFQQSDDLKDFEIICQGRSWKVLVLSLHLSVFLRACDGQFREAQEHRLNLPTHDSQVIDCLIAYMYSLEYPEVSSPVWIDVRLCILADEYDIAPLKNLCVKNFKTCADGWNPSFFTEQHASAIKFIGLAYTARGATKDICDVIVEKFVASRTMDDTANAARFEEAITAYPEFAMDVIKAGSASTSNKNASSKDYMCPNCHAVNNIDLSTAVHDHRFSCRWCHEAFPKSIWQLGVY